MPYPQNELTPMFQEPAVDLDVVLSEAQTGRLMLGVAVNSDAGLVGQILLDEQNFNWSRWPTSWDDFLSGKAWRGGGQRFRIEAAPGTEVHRYLVSFQEPYLMDTPVSLGLSGSFFDRRYDDWDEQRLGGRVSFGYQWTADDASAAISYRGERRENQQHRLAHPGFAGSAGRKRPSRLQVHARQRYARQRVSGYTGAFPAVGTRAGDRQL
jgi:outer membrane protein assembly factor BamA